MMVGGPALVGPALAGTWPMGRDGGLWPGRGAYGRDGGVWGDVAEKWPVARIPMGGGNFLRGLTLRGARGVKWGILS